MKLDFISVKFQRRSTGILQAGIKYSMRDLIRDVINYSACNCIRAKRVNTISYLISRRMRKWG